MNAVLVGLLVAVGLSLWPRACGDVLAVHPSRRSDTTADAYAVADALTLVAIALRSGCAPVDALSRTAAAVGGPIGAELRVVAAGHEWGVDTADAWALISPVWSSAATAWAAAEQAGISPGPLLTAAADALRQDADARLESAIGRASVLLVLPLGLAFLPGFVFTTVVPAVAGLIPTVLP